MCLGTMATMNTSKPIKFGTDGWRAVIADDFTYEAVRAVSQGIAAYVAGDTRPVVVGHDARFSAELFAKEVCRVLAANGIHVILCDSVAPTPVITWTVVDRKAVGGVVVTASHNPAEFNGIKYKPDYGGSASQEVVDAIEIEVERAQRDGIKEMSFADALEKGLVEKYDPYPAYEAQVARRVDLAALRNAGLHVLHDPMYGAGCGYLTRLLAGGSTTVHEVHGERNPGFAGLHPEPIAQYLPETMATMRKGGYDLAIANDGDADRIGVVDETGRFLNQLQMAALYTMYLLEQQKEVGPVVRSLTSTSMLDELGKQFNVPVIETKVGFKFIGPEMMQQDAIIGCEESGGFAFRGHIPERDGILAALYAMDMIMKYGKPLSAILAQLEERVGPHAYTRRDVRFPRDGYEAQKKRVYSLLQEQPPTEVGGTKITSTRTDDGAKLYLADGSWVLVRMSGTEPLMRIYSEAPTLGRAQELVDQLASWVESRGIALPAMAEA